MKPVSDYENNSPGMVILPSTMSVTLLTNAH